MSTESLPAAVSAVFSRVSQGEVQIATPQAWAELLSCLADAGLLPKQQRAEEGGRGEGREARGGERAAAGQGVGAQRHAGALSKIRPNLFAPHSLCHSAQHSMLEL